MSKQQTKNPGNLEYPPSPAVIRFILPPRATELRTLRGPGLGSDVTGKLTAVLEVTIDLQKLIDECAAEAMRCKDISSKRLNGAIKIAPLSTVTMGTGSAW